MRANRLDRLLLGAVEVNLEKVSATKKRISPAFSLPVAAEKPMAGLAQSRARKLL
jgi:hypothetical protein